MKSSRTLGVVATVVALAVIIGLAIWFGGQKKPTAGGFSAGPAGLTVVRGLVGSEKVAFFNDPQTQAMFARAGYEVHVDSAGSRAQLSADPSQYDFFSPGSSPVADELAAKTKGTKTPVFYSPLVIYSFAPIVDSLSNAGLVKNGSFDIAAYLAWLKEGKRWNQIPGIDPGLATPKAVLVTTTNPEKSNSGLMFSSLTAYVANGNNVVTSADEVAKVAPAIRPAFVGQGYTESSSEGPFEDYLALGAGKTPMLIGYESQLLALQIAHSPSVTPQMKAVNLAPGMVTKHVVVSRTEQGNRVADLLANDHDLGRQIARFGFRTMNPEAFNAATQEAGVTPAPLAANVVDPSPYAILDQLVAALS